MRNNNNNTDNIFSLNVNYRSSEEMIKALNNFYLGNDQRKIFVDGIEYEEIEAKKEYDFYIKTKKGKIKKGLLWVKLPTEDGENYTNANTIYEFVPQYVIYLKNHCYIDNKPISYKDIAILVRSRGDAQSIKNQLANNNIPVRVLEDTSIMDTTEARELAIILKAMLEPTYSNINSALASSIIGYDDPIYLLSDDKENEMERLNSIKQTWQEKGIFAAIFQLLREFGLYSKLYKNPTIQNQRQITNIIHLAEVLSSYELNNTASPQDLLLWFQKKISTADNSEGYELQMESEEDAVIINTIHSSKGLEFPIVILPRTNLMPNRIYADMLYSYRDEKKWVYTNKEYLDKEAYKATEYEENKRLFYVALTRAKYFTVVFYYMPYSSKNSLYKKLNIEPNNDFEELPPKESIQNDNSSQYQKKMETKVFRGDLSLKWIVTSYSALDTHTYTPAEESKSKNYDNEYERFIFDVLEKGAATGSILHKIMEDIDFANPSLSDEQKLKLKVALQLKDNDVTLLDSLIANTMEAEYKDAFGNNFSLTNIGDKVFKELEFYFSFKDFDKQRIENLLHSYNISVKIDETTSKGIIHGFIDLLFYHNGKYYILDWKSNHLGNSLENYQKSNLEQAMEENNYHLQYLLYSIALKRHLGDRFNDLFGGVFYVFMRGVRKGKDTGIYYNYPTLDLLSKLDKLLK